MVQSNSVLGRLAVQFRRSDSLFYDSQLSKETTAEACRCLKANFRERSYRPAITIWMFVGQVLSADRSRNDAVARLNVWRLAHGKKPASPGTSSYCTARQRLPDHARSDDFLVDCWCVARSLMFRCLALKTSAIMPLNLVSPTQSLPVV